MSLEWRHYVLRTMLVALAVLTASGCGRKSAGNTGLDVRAAFVKEARAQGIQVGRTLPDGRIVCIAHGDEISVSLANLEREFAQTRERDAVKRFVSTIRAATTPLPAWREAQRGIRYSAEPADHDFGDTLRDPVTDTVTRVLVYVDPAETRIRWLAPADLKAWGISRHQADQAAARNMVELVARAPIHIEAIDSYRLGMFDFNSPFKASLFLTPKLKEKIQPKLGWPVYFVIPSRDFAYFFAARDKELIPRLGKTVVDEYQKSGHPITADVREMSDSGIRAIGSFPVKQ